MEKKNNYNKEVQKRYNDKNTIYSVKYLHSENELIENIENAISKSGLSKSAWIKSAILEKLQRDDFLSK